MRNTLKILPLMLGIVLFFTQCEKEVLDEGITFDTEAFIMNADCAVVKTLWAGAGQNDTSNGTDMGTLTAYRAGDELLVVYSITKDGYELTEAHLWVGVNPMGVPANAAPGPFPYHLIFDEESGWSQLVDLSEIGLDDPFNDPIYVAAHGVVALSDDIALLEGFENLETEGVGGVKFRVLQPNGTRSYFRTEIETPGFLEGYDYVGWCIDSKGGIASGRWYEPATVYSSYGDLPVELTDSIFDYPERLPLVNWIVNNIIAGEAAPDGLGNYTRGDIQRAMWQLMEAYPNEEDVNEGPFSQARIDKIIELAYEDDGLNFVPKCGEYVVLIIWFPGNQTTIIEYPVPCVGGSDTVWAGGDEDDLTFIGLGISNKWGWVFKVDCNQ